MVKSSRPKVSATIGNGKITPTQIAFIVDRYLHDNRFSETRNLFRSEASSLLSNSPVREVLKSYLTLEDILRDYVFLREHKVALDQERATLNQEKIRVQNLLQGMQNVMNTYNASLTAPPPPPVAAPTSQPKNSTVFSSGTTPNVMSATLLGNKRVDFRSFSTPLTGHQTITGKRKAPENSAGAAPVTRKAARTTKTQGNSTANESNKKIPQAANNVSSQTPSGTLTLAKNNSSANELVMTGHGSSVAKCLFNKADSSIPASSTCFRTPQKHASPGSDKCNSPQKEATPTNCTIVTKERFTISPLKEITSYTVERSRLISSSSSPLKSSSKRDHVKGKLNFDDTDATEMSLQAPAAGNLASSSPSVSDPEVDLSDIDFSILGEDFSFSELLVDFDLGCEGSTPIAPIDTVSGSSPELGNGRMGI